MPERRLKLNQIQALLMHLKAGKSDRQVADALRLNRRTVHRYRDWAMEQGFFEVNHPLPPLEELQPLLDATLPLQIPPKNRFLAEPFREEIEGWLAKNIEMMAIYQRLKERDPSLRSRACFNGSYSSLRRFVRHLHPVTPEVTVRVERKPGEEAQADFGYAGLMKDAQGTLRRAWAFVMILAWSRLPFVQFVFDQSLRTWLTLHNNAFQFFAGVPQRLVIDNLKAAIVRALWDDPIVTMAYAECARHFGFLIAPCRPRTPEHKGKVEQGGVHYVVRNFLGGRTPTTLEQANREVLLWCRETAGRHLHGTTKERPWERFIEVEKDALQPLPSNPYDFLQWKAVKLQRDCYVTFQGSFYSAPFRRVGQRLLLAAGIQEVRLFTTDFQRVAVHPRAIKPGERHTQLDHLPPEKVPGLVRDRDRLLLEATGVGRETFEVALAFLADPVLERSHTVAHILALAHRYSPERLEAACCRARIFADPRYATIKRILEKGLEKGPLPGMSARDLDLQGFPGVTYPSPSPFARSGRELVGGPSPLVPDRPGR